jgi:hypothetical protein
MNVVPDLSNNAILQQNYVLIPLRAEILYEKWPLRKDSKLMSTHNGKMAREVESCSSNTNQFISYRKENKLSLHYEDQLSVLFRSTFAVCSDSHT